MVRPQICIINQQLLISITQTFSHSPSRGGNANITTKHEPPFERHNIGDAYQSAGHGGAGKVVEETI